jgi:hypothetical protein
MHQAERASGKTLCEEGVKKMELFYVAATFRLRNFKSFYNAG